MKYSEINIGDKETLSHIITKEDIAKFVELTGDDNKLHVDEKFAEKTQFKKPVVHGMLGASFISTIIGTKLPGDGALWFSQSLEFLLPVRVGDKLTVTSEVIKKNDSEKIIELKTDIYNQNRQIVTRGLAKVKVIEQDILKAETGEKLDIGPKVALVVGGTGGLGRAACIRLAKDGFNVIIHYNKNKTLAEELKKEIEELNIKVIALQADILNDSEIKELISKGIRTFDKIDVVVNCAAAIIPDIKIQDLLWTDFQKQLDINLRSVFNITKEVLPSMLKYGYGKIINIGSSVVDKPNNSWAHYITGKSALAGFTKALAFELAPKGIRVNLISPSLIDTDLTANIPLKIKLLSSAQTPLRRLANVSDVAGAISFLASDKSDFITGENIRINGGQVMI